MLNSSNRYICLFRSRIVHNFVNIQRYCTAIQKQTISNELTPANNLYDKHLSEWSVNDVIIWLSRIENGVYSNYINCFENQRIDGLTLQYLSENDLNDLGITIMGDRKHIMHSLHKLFRFYDINMNSAMNVMETDNVNDTANDIAVHIGDTKTDEIIKADIDSDTLQLQLFDANYELPQVATNSITDNNMAENILRVEYDCPWSTDRFHEHFNKTISELFLSQPEICDCIDIDIDDRKHSLILHGNFMQLSDFLKHIYQLNNCPTISVLPRISHFLMDCGELQRICKLLAVIPFICDTGKLSFYSSTNIIYAKEACDGIKSLLKTFDCSYIFGSPQTSIIGTLLSMDYTKTLFINYLTRYGYIQFWNRGHSIFHENDYKFTRQIYKNNIYHLLLVKSFSQSMDTVDKMHQTINDLASQNSEYRAADIGLIGFVLNQYKNSFIQTLQDKHNVYIGGCLHSKTVYVCGGKDAQIRQEILSELCDKSILSKLAYCKLNDTNFKQYIFNCSSLAHFRAVKKLYNKQMKMQFVYDDDNELYIVTPSIYESDCKLFIENVLEPSLLTIQTNKNNVLHEFEYKTLMSKLSDPKDFLTPHIAVDEKKENLYVFHKKLMDAKYRKFLKSEIIRYQNMKYYVIDIMKMYSWFTKYMDIILKRTIVHWGDTNSALITLLNENKSINIRSNNRIFEKLKYKFNEIINGIFQIPIYERLYWIKYYELNNNINVLNDKQFMYCFDDENGMYYLYNNDMRKSIEWINKYFEIVLEIGLTYNKFPNHEYILKRDCKFIIQILIKNQKNALLLLENTSIVDFISVMIYQCVLSTRYDLCIAIWKNINRLQIEKQNNILVTNFLNTVFIIGCKEFVKSDMKSFLVRSKILFNQEIIKFIIKKLKENKQINDMQLINDVLQDIHLDNDIEWTFNNINWNI